MRVMPAGSSAGKLPLGWRALIIKALVPRRLEREVSVSPSATVVEQDSPPSEGAAGQGSGGVAVQQVRLHRCHATSQAVGSAQQPAQRKAALAHGRTAVTRDAQAADAQAGLVDLAGGAVAALGGCQEIALQHAQAVSSEDEEGASALLATARRTLLGAGGGGAACGVGGGENRLGFGQRVLGSARARPCKPCSAASKPRRTPGNAQGGCSDCSHVDLAALKIKAAGAGPLGAAGRHGVGADAGGHKSAGVDAVGALAAGQQVGLRGRDERKPAGCISRDQAAPAACLRPSAALPAPPLAPTPP